MGNEGEIGRKTFQLRCFHGRWEERHRKLKLPGHHAFFLINMKKKNKNKLFF